MVHNFKDKLNISYNIKLTIKHYKILYYEVTTVF